MANPHYNSLEICEHNFQSTNYHVTNEINKVILVPIMYLDLLIKFPSIIGTNKNAEFIHFACVYKQEKQEDQMN